MLLFEAAYHVDSQGTISTRLLRCLSVRCLEVGAPIGGERYGREPWLPRHGADARVLRGRDVTGPESRSCRPSLLSTRERPRHCSRQPNLRRCLRCTCRDEHGRQGDTLSGGSPRPQALRSGFTTFSSDLLAATWSTRGEVYDPGDSLPPLGRRTPPAAWRSGFRDRARD